MSTGKPGRPSKGPRIKLPTMRAHPDIRRMCMEDWRRKGFDSEGEYIVSLVAVALGREDLAPKPRTTAQPPIPFEEGLREAG